MRSGLASGSTCTLVPILILSVRPRSRYQGPVGWQRGRAVCRNAVPRATSRRGRIPRSRRRCRTRQRSIRPGCGPAAPETRDRYLIPLIGTFPNTLLPTFTNCHWSSAHGRHLPRFEQREIARCIPDRRHGRPSESRTVDLAILSEGLSVQEASQRLTSVVLGLPGHAGIRRTIEPVIRPRIHVQLDWNPGSAQSIRIGQVFFKEEIGGVLLLHRSPPSIVAPPFNTPE